MAVVGFDTATADTAVCSTRGGTAMHEERLGLGPDGSPRHSTALLDEVERAAAAIGGWGAVDRIAVGLGPGSFVGIRIAIATARGLAASTGLPMTGVCTLDALGHAAGEAVGPDRACLVVLDARRGEAFAALYSADGSRLWEPFVAAPEELADRVGALPQPPLAVGSGAVRFRDELASRDVEVPGDADPVHRVAARHVCTLAEADDGGDGDRLEPIYLRPPDAQRWRERNDAKTAE
ncbi:MAG TPA: tRNA (adenosine(37)-N6)-threonylcarbamoyltransferase complex dimerization subunit type 1 TsaB [Solirubrobacterales bacterium]|jgi:tRNA threonylcarbamoyladenosine biosynthesis protein TsaB